MPIPRPSVEEILGEFRQQDYVTVDGRIRTFVRTDRTLIRKTISLLQDRSDDEAVKLRRHEHAQPPPMDERQTPYMSFRSARNASRHAPLHVRSERSPLHDVRQHAHANDAWTRRIACANSFSRTSWQGFAELRAKSGGARRNRTDDLLLAKQALSQLSYGPALRHQRSGNGGPGKI